VIAVEIPFSVESTVGIIRRVALFGDGDRLMSGTIASHQRSEWRHCCPVMIKLTPQGFLVIFECRLFR